MLTHLYIENFTIIHKLDLLWQSGMTVITGETGAGKSIVLDALSLVLGERVESPIVRVGARQCEIVASFTLDDIPAAKTWLEEQSLVSDDECLLRRSFSADNRSKCFINGKPVTLQLLRELGSLLVNMHGQHEHQQLMNRDAQAELLDRFAGHAVLVDEVKALYKEWHALISDIEKKRKQLGDRDSRLAFLKYQVSEFEAIQFSHDELLQLETEQKQLSSVASRTETYQKLLQILENTDISHAVSLSNMLPDKNIAELLESAQIQIEEASNELESALSKAEMNPERLQEIENRLTKIHELARKHRVKLEELSILEKTLQDELQTLEQVDDQIVQLENALKAVEVRYEKASQVLSDSREKAAKKMAKLIENHMQTLGMSGGRFEIKLEASQSPFNIYGREKISFWVSANPGQPLQLLNKVASGGELSRISLAIQLIAAQKEKLPTLIFDEVDVGIGGNIAAMVGQLLKKLAKQAQVICVTHLPQVASQGAQHLQVQKHKDKKQTVTEVVYLSPEARIQEVARMLGGLKITDQTLSHAKEMVEESVS